MTSCSVRKRCCSHEFYQPLSEGAVILSVAPQLRVSQPALIFYVDDLLSARVPGSVRGPCSSTSGRTFLQYGQARLGSRSASAGSASRAGSVALPSSGTTNIRAAVFD